MIEYKKGDLLACNTEAIVNTVNCVGVMGRGIALQFKKQHPENFKYYEAACKSGDVVPGKMLVFETNGLINPQLIINFPTKRHWRGASRIEDIKNGLVDLIDVIRKYNITSIAIPPLGCGLGGLNWKDVKPCIESALARLDNVDVIVFEPDSSSSTKIVVHNRAVPDMTPGRAALVSLVKLYLDGFLDPFITLLEIHKLTYFLQECGEPLKLNYIKCHYGPYATNLSNVLNHIEGHMLSGYIKDDNKPGCRIQIIPGADMDAAAFLAQCTETTARINRVGELIDGFETPFGMELLATVHWIAKDMMTPTLDDITERIYEWGEQKRKFSRRQIQIALGRLSRNGWLETHVNIE